MAKIKLTSGQLYFLREKDFLTGEISRYVKIGLVRDAKETEERIREHQTGNPREIYDYCSLESPFVEHLETLMHYWHAPKWITGEWFDMTEAEIDQAIDQASQLIEEQLESQPTLEKSYSLGSLESSGEIMEQSNEAVQVWEKLVNCKLELDALNAQKAILNHKLRSILGNAGSIKGVLSVSIKSSADRFNEKLFSEQHEALYQSYCTKERSTLSSAFTLKGKKTLKNELPELDAQKRALDKIELSAEDIELDMTVERDAIIEQFHEEYINLQREIYIKDWEYTRLEASLKVLTDVHDGIEDLCGWKREMKHKKAFDKKRFEEDYPELYKEYLMSIPDSFAVNVFSWRNY